jgi:cytochrome c oxidase subunit 4
MLLLLLTVALAYAPWGGLTTAGGLVIAIVKTALVVAWFMELATAKSLLRLVALAGVVFLLVLFGLTLADTLARHFGS